MLDLEHDSVQSLLPSGYTVDPHCQPTVLVEVMELRNLPWLAGRGYNTLGIYINDVICHRVSPPVKASYLAVLFENRTDPITTGREELGFPKVYADIPNATLTLSPTPNVEASRIHTLSRDGFEFLRLELQHLTSCPVQSSPALRPQSRSYAHPTKDGILHQRYIPAVGEPGKADADYATFCPPPPNAPTVLEFKTLPQGTAAGGACPAIIELSPTKKGEKGALEFFGGAVKLQIKRGSFEQLPTLYNVVDGLAALKVLGCREVALQQFKGASDLGEFFLPNTADPVLIRSQRLTPISFFAFHRESHAGHHSQQPQDRALARYLASEAKIIA